MKKSNSTFPTLGILGGGQLARMTAYAAFQLGMRVHILERFPDSPAGSIAHKEVVGETSDAETLREFASECDVVTLESEFINEEHLSEIESAGYQLFPSSSTVGKIQDKVIQKQTLQAVGIPTATFRSVETYKEAELFGREHGYPFVLKSRRGGYDGYGNATIASSDQIVEAWEGIKGDELRNAFYCESFVPFEKELAIMIARNKGGAIAHYPVVETIQKNHICHTVTAPANVNENVVSKVREYAAAAIEAIEGVGIFGVELFLTNDGGVLVNELAPRPHNSGHYTIEGCVVSQFENHIRAIMNWSLGSTDLNAPGVAMVNILGRSQGVGAVDNYSEVLRLPEAHLHIYGKLEERIGRKMGHITVLSSSVEEARKLAEQAESEIRFSSATSETGVGDG